MDAVVAMTVMRVLLFVLQKYPYTPDVCNPITLELIKQPIDVNSN